VPAASARRVLSTAEELVENLVATILQNHDSAFINSALSLEPGRICVIMFYSQIAPACPKPDAFFAL
jgi:hypothetical protein